MVSNTINAQLFNTAKLTKPAYGGVFGFINEMSIHVCAHTIILVVEVSYVLHVPLIPFPFLTNILYIHYITSHPIARFQTLKYRGELATGSEQHTTYIVSRCVLRSV